MSQACLLCGRTAPHRNLFCPDADCPAEQSPVLLDQGDWLDDIEIVRRVVLLRSSALYVALRQGQTVYVKVAHPGPDHRARLVRETEALRLLERTTPASDTLARPLATPGGARSGRWRQTVRQRVLLTYTLFEYVEGEPLRDLLAQHPQWWITHVAWLVSRLAETVHSLHHHGLYHLGLSPECVLVRFDAASGAPRPLLVDLGLACDREGVERAWYPSYLPLAYTAPELIAPPDGGRQADGRTDVYGLGLLLYEMLLGRPVFDAGRRSQPRVREMVRRSQRGPMDRLVDVEPVAQIALKATHAEREQRQACAAQVAEDLLREVGAAPPTPRRAWPNRRTVLVVLSACLTLLCLAAIAVWVG